MLKRWVFSINPVKRYSPDYWYYVCETKEANVILTMNEQLRPSIHMEPVRPKHTNKFDIHPVIFNSKSV